MTTDNDNEPVFSDIPTTTVPPPKKGSIWWHSLYVPKRSAPDAMPLIEDFNKNGKKTFRST